MLAPLWRTSHPCCAVVHLCTSTFCRPPLLPLRCCHCCRHPPPLLLPAGVGYLAYGLMHNGPEFLNKRTAVGLSDPVCDPQHYATIAAAFLQQHPEAMFAQVCV